jgi:hypothetical protein
MAGMPRTSRLSLLAVAFTLAALALGGCAEDSPAIPDAPTTTTAKKAKFPLSVQRMGGVAGFSDRLSIQDDGVVLANTKRGQVECTLDAASLATLNTVALRLEDTDTPTSTAIPGMTADAMPVLFSAGTALVEISDPRIAEAEPVITQVLADVTGPAGQGTLCR